MKNSVKQGDEKIRENRCLEPMPDVVLQKCLEEDHSTFIISFQRHTIEIQFCLKQPDDHEIQQKKSSVICLPGFKGTILCAFISNIHSRKLYIRFNLSFLEIVIGIGCSQILQLLGRIPGKEFIDARESAHDITPQMKIIINELLHCDKGGNVRKLFWQSRILELLRLQIEQMEEANKPLSNIKYYDIEKLREAKSIVENNLVTPYSLKTLAHKVGLNDFKLKRGFKELFGYTVYGYLRELRMQEARKLLLTGRDSVAGVSGEVGYQHPHHFSAAF